MNPHDHQVVEIPEPPRDVLFTLRNAAGRTVVIARREHPLGAELVVEVDGDLRSSQVHRTATALAHDAQEKRAQLLERGWQEVAGPIDPPPAH